MDKKKNSNSGTMKPMSAHDEKTLDTAVAMANEITTKSMNDLESEQKPLNSPCEKSKFHFKFPLVSSLHATHHDTDKDPNSKGERRNFSEEAKSVPDIQATLTEESKQAYASLIEQPTPSSSLISHINHDIINATLPKPSTIPKPAPRTLNAAQQFHSLQKMTYPHRNKTSEFFRDIKTEINKNRSQSNSIPLPPRGSKPKLVDKPRHFRKYPLRLDSNTYDIKTQEVVTQVKPQPIIYQNTVSCTIARNRVKGELPDVGIDVFDGPSGPVKSDTNPFIAIPDESIEPGPSSVNPFKCYLEDSTFDNNKDKVDVAAAENAFAEVSLNKDHVSVEDLLEFADQKPSARQRGVESDEVRIMSKVLKQQVTPERCLEALEFSGWNVHIAIKLLRVKIAVGEDTELSFEDCQREIEVADGDIVKASAVLVLSNKDKQT